MFSRLLGRHWGAVVSASGIIFYTLLVGANPAVVRAAFLGILTLLGHQLGQRQVGLNSLALIAAIMAVFNPTILWDVSFQLSFAATLGIMLYAEPLASGFIKFITRLATRSIPITHMQPGHSLDLGSGATLEATYTSSRGAVLLLEWGNFRMLLPMGMDLGALEDLQLISAMRNISAVLLPESGYAPLYPPELISFLHPQLALLSVAPADSSGLPSTETLEALQGYNFLRTDLDGLIELTTDGRQM
ncbi:MAG: hypothetical protein A2136_10730 [Chloroflexi bacterium RBG_16_54_11]|nr:MAG: hypothetical protein A2136_10730 [Chloroflexi bacterium RBG_16_54_11]